MAKSNKRETILLAAAKLFRDRGYQATSMRDLAEAVQLKASSLYNHIGSKEEILKEICMQNAAKFSQGMDAIKDQDLTPIQKIEELLKLHIEIASNDYTAITSFNDEWRHLGEPTLSDFKAKRKSYESQFLKIIEEGIDNREIKKMDAQICLNTLLSSTRWVYDYQSRKQVESSSGSILAILLTGIKN